MKTRLVGFLGLSIALGVAGADVVDRDVVRNVVDYARGSVMAEYGGTVPDDLPVGVFDSGIGGLTVLEAILAVDAYHNDTLQPGADGKPDFAGERFIYLGDQANMPYGNYSAAGRTDFLRELILRDALFLLGQRYWTKPGGELVTGKPPVKAIVIACNTATAYGLEDIREAIAAWKIPVIVVGVVEAGARGVAESLPRDMGSQGVGVLATVGTCATGAYPKRIGTATGQAGKSPPVVIQQGSVGLAGAIEGDPGFVVQGERGSAPYLGPMLHSTDGYLPEGLRWAGDGSWQINSVENYIRYDLRSLLAEHEKNVTKEPISRLVLGCTHFPLVKTEILSVLSELRQQPEFGSRIAEKVELVNPAELTAKELFRELAKARLRSKSSSDAGQHTFYISTPNPGAEGVKLDASGRLERAYQYGRLPGQPGRLDTVVVPMTPEVLPGSSTQLLQRHLPLVWQALLQSASLHASRSAR